MLLPFLQAQLFLPSALHPFNIFVSKSEWATLYSETSWGWCRCLKVLPGFVGCPGAYFTPIAIILINWLLIYLRMRWDCHPGMARTGVPIAPAPMPNS